MAVICVDAGTTMIKAVGYDDAGAESVVERRPATVSRPRPGWAEQDMLAVWDAVGSAVRDVANRLGSRVDYLALTAQGDGCWLVDGSGAPTGTAILWNDGRAAGIVEDWRRSGVLAEAFRINGSLGFAGLPNAILTWLRANEPDRLQRSAAFLTCGGWLFARMTGELAVDESDGSAPFLDIRSRRYSPHLLRLFDMDWAQPLLPDVRSDDRRVGHLHAASAAELCLPSGTPVVMSSYDIASTAIGVGAVSPFQACSILGTTICTEVVTQDLHLDEEASGLTVALGLPGRYLRAFPTLAGGEVVEWACRLLGLADPAELGELATACAAGADGLIFLPYLSPAGERAPFLDPLARGAFLGLSTEHVREQVARAVLEGLSLVVRDCLVASRAEPVELRVCGGGAANSTWLQLLADVTGLPVRRSSDAEIGARGAFLVGLVATGAADTAEDAAAAYVRIAHSFEPDARRAAFYAAMYADFLAARAATTTVETRLATMRQRSARLADAPTGLEES